METTKDAEKASDEYYARHQKMLGQLGNWTMAANGGGIAFVLTTAREATMEPVLLASAYSTFLGGLIAGFVGHLCLALASSMAGYYFAFRSGQLSVYEESLEEAKKVEEATGKPVPDYLKEGPPQKGHTIFVVASVVGGLLYIIAAGLAVAGLATPLTIGFPTK